MCGSCLRALQHANVNVPWVTSNQYKLGSFCSRRSLHWINALSSESLSNLCRSRPPAMLQWPRFPAPLVCLHYEHLLSVDITLPLQDILNITHFISISTIIIKRTNCPVPEHQYGNMMNHIVQWFITSPEGLSKQKCISTTMYTKWLFIYTYQVHITTKTFMQTP